MECLTTNTQPTVYHKQPNANNPIPLKWHTVLALHLSGKKDKEIALETGYTANSVWRILNHKDVQYVRQQLLANTQKEFEAQFVKVVDNVNKGLDDPDAKIRAIYINMWLKAHGKFANESKGNGQVNITAEDVVLNMLNGNVDAKQ
jgi:hypothetical protein